MKILGQLHSAAALENQSDSLSFKLCQTFGKISETVTDEADYENQQCEQRVFCLKGQLSFTWSPMCSKAKYEG